MDKKKLEFRNHNAALCSSFVDGKCPQALKSNCSKFFLVTGAYEGVN
jgi:hypothetical protein